MKKFILVASLFMLYHLSRGQQVVDVEENNSYKNNGIEYGYYITNEQSKEVKGEDYDRYQVTLFVTNNSGCTKIIPFKAGVSQPSDDDLTVAEFACTNANGKRLTAKSGKVQAKPWFARVRVNEEGSTDKFKFINAQVGYAVNAGQTISTKIIVIVPKGERPKINCRTVYFPDL